MSHPQPPGYQLLDESDDQIEMFGLTFNVRLTEEGSFELWHQHFGLIGHGRSLESAKADLLSRAESVHLAYQQEPCDPKKYSPELVDVLAFCERAAAQ